MIITVFCTNNNERDHWRSELLEWSWLRAGQSGELVRLVACSGQETLPQHSLARVVRTHSWSPHPFTGDRFSAYDLPASLLEWLFTEKPDATILVLDACSVFHTRVHDEATLGQAIANAWPDIPVDGSGPFGLATHYEPLVAYCVNRALELPQIQLPVLIHASDLVKIAARWLELIGILRAEVPIPQDRGAQISPVAYAIAVAEYRLQHKTRNLAANTGGGDLNLPFFDYRQPIKSDSGEIVWDWQSYKPWNDCQPEASPAGAGREFLAFLQEFVTLREAGGHLRFIRPRRRLGVREARVANRALLEIPQQPDSLSLNDSAAEIWSLCDDQRTLADIVDTLEKKYGVARATLNADIELCVQQLCAADALELEAAHS